MPLYDIKDMDRLEENARRATPAQQQTALRFVVGLLEGNCITYGVMGGMNFFLRGSGRATDDVDLAIDSPPLLGNVLELFGGRDRQVDSPPRIRHVVSAWADVSGLLFLFFLLLFSPLPNPSKRSPLTPQFFNQGLPAWLPDAVAARDCKNLRDTRGRGRTRRKRAMCAV